MKSTEALFRINKNFWRKNQGQGAHGLSTRQGARPPISWAPRTSSDLNSNSIYIVSGRKKIKEKVSSRFTTQSRRQALISLGRADLESVRGFGEGGFVAVIIINHPPSPISWCSPPCVSNSIVGLLDGNRLDAIFHVNKLVLLGFHPMYPLCSEIDVAMTLLCLMLVTRAWVPWFQIWTYYVFMNICVFLILSYESIVTYYVLWSDHPEVTIIGILLGDDRSLGVRVFTMC